MNDLWAAQRKFPLSRSDHLPQHAPSKGCVEELWADILEREGHIDEREADVQDWKRTVQSSVGDLQPDSSPWSRWHCELLVECVP